MKEDKDLEFLAFCKNEDLQILVDYLTTDMDSPEEGDDPDEGYNDD